jgi:SnoaL-like domain
MDSSRIGDIIEIDQLLARYAVGMTADDIDIVMAVFAPGGWYSAFGERYGTSDFPALAGAAPKGLYLVGTPAIELDGDTATGKQPLCFVAQTDHEMRIGYYTDSYTRTDAGWRLQTRTMTFLRRSGVRDSGKPHDPRRPRPVATPAG